jgi:hypothetical protein
MIRLAVLGLATAGGALLAAGPAMAATGDADAAHAVPTAGPGDLTPSGDLTPAGVPVLGLVQSVVGATKAVPGQSGSGY